MATDRVLPLSAIPLMEREARLYETREKRARTRAIRTQRHSDRWSEVRTWALARGLKLQPLRPRYDQGRVVQVAPQRIALRNGWTGIEILIGCGLAVQLRQVGAGFHVAVVAEDGYGRVPVRTLLRLLGRIAAEG
jgi:hypothetical protein